MSSLIEGGTDVVLRVELVQSFIFSTCLDMLVLFSIFIFLRCGFFVFIYSLLALGVRLSRWEAILEKLPWMKVTNGN